MPAVLLYHRVADVNVDPFGLCLAPGVFREQLRFLRDRCCPMPLRQLVDSAKGGCRPADAVAVTFDDGYLDNLSVASPMLSEFEIPATFFITTAPFDDLHEFWWDTLARLVLDEDAAPMVLETSVGTHTQFSMSSVADRHATLHAVHAVMRVLPRDRRDGVLRQLMNERHLARTAANYARPMNAGEVLRLASHRGHDIGVHTSNHLWLPAQPRDVQRDEIVGAKVALESLLSRPVTTLAYPFGASNSETAAIARTAGINLALTATEGVLEPGVDPLMVPRLTVTANSSPSQLAGLCRGPT
jgi:peptidoglycan/xylan/chitin deacetylase (PgdA/CDA1 family)